MITPILFSGHRLDEPDRTTPRFPASRISDSSHAIAATLPANAGVGISSAANGGDILFLEACAARAIPCHIILPFPPEKFVQTSVATDAPGDWVARFRFLWGATPDTRRRVLMLTDDTSPYAACNNALIEMAGRLGRPRVIALWDGKESDRPGGTDDLVAKTRARGWPVTVITP